MKEPRSAIARDDSARLDPCALFNNHIDRLYTLALLLTVDLDQAEQCCVTGLEDCLQGRPRAREWAESWARRVIIQNAIRVVSPVPEKVGAATETEAKTSRLFREESEPSSFMTAITRLQPFERFVFVMSVLEGYSSGACAILLHCTVTDVAEARFRALQRLAQSLSRNADGPTTALQMNANQCLQEGASLRSLAGRAGEERA